MSWSESASSGAKVISLIKAEPKEKEEGQEEAKTKKAKTAAAAAAASSRLSLCNVTLEVVAGPPKVPPQPTEPPPKEPEQEPEVEMEEEEEEEEEVTGEPPPKKSSSVNNLGSFFLCLAPSCQFETTDGEEFLRHEREEHFQVIHLESSLLKGAS